MSNSVEVGQKFVLKNQTVDVVKCERDGCDHLMVNLDADQLAPGDLVTLKTLGVRISNPETKNQLCVNCEVKTFAHKVSSWFDKDDDNDDSSFFSGSSFGGSSSFGGFGGFGGAGATRGF